MNSERSATCADSRWGKRGGVRRALAAAGFLLIGGVVSLAVFVEGAAAQGLGDAFGGFAASPDAPINIEAERLDVDDQSKRATFSGGVVARQDTFVMNSATLEIRYAPRGAADRRQASAAGGAASGFGGGSTEITELIARGSVLVRSLGKETQTAAGDWARFDTKQRIITMGDTVTLTQGKNVIRGTRLVINLATGKSSVLSDGGPVVAGGKKKPGRIRMVITPDQALRAQRGVRRQNRATSPQRRTTSGSTVRRARSRE
ncbi:MAG: LptA/OstA family protein [Pseudomonadota bacterium]